MARYIEIEVVLGGALTFGQQSELEEILDMRDRDTPSPEGTDFRWREPVLGGSDEQSMQAYVDLVGKYVPCSARFRALSGPYGDESPYGEWYHSAPQVSEGRVVLAPRQEISESVAMTLEEQLPCVVVRDGEELELDDRTLHAVLFGAAAFSREDS